MPGWQAEQPVRLRIRQPRRNKRRPFAGTVGFERQSAVVSALPATDHQAGILATKTEAVEQQ